MKPLVSILIPAYNAERWIRDTMQSALDQTWQRKELIVVDDGSTDDTLRIAQSFESVNVKVVTQQNAGGGVARNKAFSLAQGDYIQWIDHDDLLAPNKIEVQLLRAEREATERTLLSGNFSTFFYCTYRAKPVVNSMCRDLDTIEFFISKFEDDAWLQIGAYLFSRTLSEAADGWYHGQSTDDDGDYVARIVAASDRILFVPEAMSYWRIGNFSSAGHFEKGKNLEAALFATKRSINQLLALENSERTRKACLRFLQYRAFRYFYPEQREMLAELKQLATNLGGELTLPKTGKRFTLVQNIFGWRAAKTADDLRYAADMIVQRNIDRLHWKRSREKRMMQEVA